MTGRSSTTPPGNRPESGPETTAPVPPTAAPAPRPTRAEGRARRKPAGGPRRRLLPRPRVVLGCLLLAVFVGVLIVQAYINSEFTSDHLDSEVGDQSQVPVSIRGGGPVVNTTGGQHVERSCIWETAVPYLVDGPFRGLSVGTRRVRSYR